MVATAVQVSHMPHGPTAYFGLKNVVLRHDLPQTPANMSEARPHLIFHDFSTKVRPFRRLDRGECSMRYDSTL